MSGIHEESLTHRTGSTLLGIRRSDNLSDAPTPKVEPTNTSPRSEVPVHRFCNREARYRLVVEGAAWAGQATWR